MLARCEEAATETQGEAPLTPEVASLPECANDGKPRECRLSYLILLYSIVEYSLHCVIKICTYV